MMQIDLSLEAAEDEERAVEEGEDGGRLVEEEEEEDKEEDSHREENQKPVDMIDHTLRLSLFICVLPFCDVSRSLGAESGQAPKMVVADQGMDSDDATELSLSLSLQTHADPHKRVDARAEKDSSSSIVDSIPDLVPSASFSSYLANSSPHLPTMDSFGNFYQLFLQHLR
ncbi:hypothetical protein BHE74_00041394 [Ensete ventricosum]|nr:hypothetical protein BHE74_00041394 [Ensete ventricosum]